MTSTYSISFLYNGSVTFNGTFTVNNTTNIIESFYDSNNNSILSQGCNTFQNIYNNLTGNLLCSLLLINSGSYLILEISSSQSYYFIDTTQYDVGIYNVWFELQYAENTFVSEKNQLQIFE